MRIRVHRGNWTAEFALEALRAMKRACGAPRPSLLRTAAWAIAAAGRGRTPCEVENKVFNLLCRRRGWPWRLAAQRARRIGARLGRAHLGDGIYERPRRAAAEDISMKDIETTVQP